MLLHGNTGLVEVALHRLAYAVAVSDFLLAVLVNCGDALFSIAVADLNCLIAVILDCLDLCDYAGASLKDCYRNQSTVFLEDLGHTDLGCHNSFLHVYLFSAALCGEMIYSGHRRVLFLHRALASGTLFLYIIGSLLCIPSRFMRFFTGWPFGFASCLPQAVCCLAAEGTGGSRTGLSSSGMSY